MAREFLDALAGVLLLLPSSVHIAHDSGGARHAAGAQVAHAGARTPGDSQRVDRPVRRGDGRLAAPLQRRRRARRRRRLRRALRGEALLLQAALEVAPQQHRVAVRAPNHVTLLDVRHRMPRDGALDGGLRQRMSGTSAPSGGRRGFVSARYTASMQAANQITVRFVALLSNTRYIRRHLAPHTLAPCPTAFVLPTREPIIAAL